MQAGDEHLLQRNELVVQRWIDALADYTEEDLHKKPAANQWSIGQVYHHISRAGVYFYRQALNCLDPKAGSSDEGLTRVGRLMLDGEHFPDRRFKMPDALAEEPPVDCQKNELREALHLARNLLRQVADKLPQAKDKSKVRHPVFGMMNAYEWYRQAAMHFEHHLHQKRRIDEFLGSGQ